MAINPPLDTTIIREDYENDVPVSKNALRAEFFIEIARALRLLDETHLTQLEHDSATVAATPSVNGLLSAADKTILNALNQYAIDSAAAIQFKPDTYDDAGTDAVVVTVLITDTSGVKIPVYAATQVQVNIDSDTTPGSLATLDGTASPTTIALTNGIGTVIVAAVAGGGTVTLSLTDIAGTGLTLFDTASVVFQP